MPTGIRGFDELLGGGLPRGRTTLVVGGPGCGKTVFALQTLINGVRDGEPGVFVAFEEPPDRIIANAASFGWSLDSIPRKDLCILDARLSNAVVVGGEFDLLGLFAAIEAKVAQLGARRIVLDGLDVLLSSMNDPAAERRELYRLGDWLSEQKLTSLITCKMQEDGSPSTRESSLQFIVDCVVAIQHRLVGSLPLRLLRVTKCRGLAHATGEVPFAITATGIKLVSYGAREDQYVSSQRVSSGLAGLDTMLAGGFFKGTTVLVSGSPGTAKSTVAGAFIEAALERGEPSLYVTFDEPAAHVVRNMASVSIELAPFVKSGLLQIISERNVEKSPVEHVARIVEVIEAHNVQSLVIDPVSSLTAFGSAPIAEELVLRLLDYARSRGITVLCTTMLAGGNGLLEETGTGVSTIPDTWIHLSYVIRNGERNRVLTIVKSRGIAHSKQVRELVVSDSGVTLRKPYAGSGDLLMGTMRRQKEKQQHLNERGVATKRRDAKFALAETNVRIANIKREAARHETVLQQTEDDATPPPKRRGRSGAR